MNHKKKTKKNGYAVFMDMSDVQYKQSSGLRYVGVCVFR